MISKQNQIHTFSVVQHFVSSYASKMADENNERWEVRFGGVYLKGIHRMQVGIYYNGLFVHELQLVADGKDSLIKHATPVDEDSQVYEIIGEWQSKHLQHIDKIVSLANKGEI
jgi:hypothetical protein